jgi:hypothetical protein
LSFLILFLAERDCGDSDGDTRPSLVLVLADKLVNKGSVLCSASTDKMKPRKQAKNAILKLLETSPRQSEHELRQNVCNDSVPKKHVEKALQKLQKKKKIIKSEGYYSLLKEEENSKMDEQRTKLETVPVAELLRRRQQEKSGDGVGFETDVKKVNLDDEIQRLEAELAADNSDDESDSAMEDEDKRKVTFGANTVLEIESTQTDTPTSIHGLAVVCLSSLAKERIAPLPSSCLPQNKKRKLNGIDENVVARPKKQKVSSGLEEAVREVLSEYVARSSEKLPFYCRVCAKQYTNEKEFFDHKGGDFHMAAVEMERKASFCKLCRKQFTSPVQLKEHVSSRPHRERLQKVRSRQSPRRINRGVHRGKDGQSQRQWC